MESYAGPSCVQYVYDIYHPSDAALSTNIFFFNHIINRQQIRLMNSTQL